MKRGLCILGILMVLVVGITAAVLDRVSPNAAPEAAVPNITSEKSTGSEPEQVLPAAEAERGMKLVLLGNVSGSSDSELEQIRYTQVPGMPTQDFVLSFEEVRGEQQLDVAVEEPDKLTKNTLFDIYDFVKESKKMPVRYFDEDVQQAVEALLPDGTSVDILHMTEFMQVLPQKAEQETDAKATVTIDVDYRPGRLVIVMVGDRSDPENIQWTPMKAAVTDVGKIVFTVPQELVKDVQGEDCIFLVLTDRIGTRGGVLKNEDGKQIISYPSKTAGDIVVIEHPTGKNAEELPEDFLVREVNETTVIRKEMDGISSFLAGQEPLFRFYPASAQHEASLILPDSVDPDSLIAYETMNVDCVNYRHAFGDVLCRIRFATPYADGQGLVVMLGIDADTGKEPEHELKWVALRSEVVDGYVNITFPQAALEIMEERPALMVVLSEEING